MYLINGELAEVVRFVGAYGPGIPSSAAPQWVSMKGYEHCAIIIQASNAGAGVTASAITLQQAQTVTGTGAKALPFTRARLNNDRAAGSALTLTAVENNTFTLDATVSKDLLAVLNVKAEDLDTDNDFDCVRVALANAAAQTVTVTYALYNSKFGEGATALDPRAN